MAINLDNIEIVFLADGRIKVITDPISQANHTNADKFIKEMARLMGGEVIIEKRSDSHHHHHHHDHSHSHEDGGHSHSH